jgi:hypothetical protein
MLEWTFLLTLFKCHKWYLNECQWLLFNTFIVKWAMFQIYHDKNKLHYFVTVKMTVMTPVLYYNTHTTCSSQADMSLHSDTLP